MSTQKMPGVVCSDIFEAFCVNEGDCSENSLLLESQKSSVIGVSYLHRWH